MDRPALEVADIFRRYGEEYRTKHGASMSPQQFRVMRDIELCRTAVLGGHMKACDNESCDHWEISYNSCRNRHCPKCQSMAKASWLTARQNEILPVHYYHLIFTLPDNLLGPIALQNKDIFYNLLFHATAHTLLTTAADHHHLGAQIGFLAILHTWGQKLTYHPHLHCLAPGGGLSPDREKWISCSPEFFLDVEVLSRCFQQVLLTSLENAFKKDLLQFHGTVKHLCREDDFDQLLDSCREIDWVVYAKPPFGGPETVLDYLARYTHRVAISNHRLLSIKNNKVTFTWKDYKHGAVQKNLTLGSEKFIRRFLLHLLPNGFTRIRYYGLFANRHRAENLRHCRKLLNYTLATTTAEIEKLDWPELLLALTGQDPFLCPRCCRGHLVIVKTLQPLPKPVLSHAREPPIGDSS
jgi:hypothetical protein